MEIGCFKKYCRKRTDLHSFAYAIKIIARIPSVRIVYYVWGYDLRMCCKTTVIACLIFICINNVYSENANKSSTKPFIPKKLCNIKKEAIPHPSIVHGAFTAEFIYLKPIGDGLRYAFSGTADPANPPSPPLPTSESLEQKFTYSPGFRVGAIANLLYHQWELNAFWTRLHHQFPTSSVSDDNGQLFANLAVPAIGYISELCTYASGRWDLNIDVFNLELRNRIHLNKAVVITPIIGVQGFLIHQKFNVFYVLLDDFSIPRYEPYNQYIKERTQSWGVGPEIGAEFKMVIPCQLTLFLKGTAAYMAGKYAVSTKYPNIIDYQPNSNIVLNDDNYRLFTMSQLRGGISRWWEFRSHYSLEIVVGWEAQFWARQQISNWFNTLSLPSSSDLTLWGPFGSLSFGF